MNQQAKSQYPECICAHEWERHRHTHSGKLITGAFCSGQGCQCKEYVPFTRGVKAAKGKRVSAP